jgi:coatomer subunit alpha
VCLPKITKKSNSPTATTDAIFYAGTGALLCRSEDKVKMFRLPDQVSRKGPQL